MLFKPIDVSLLLLLLHNNDAINETKTEENSTNQTSRINTETKYANWTFADYMQKFKPSAVQKQLAKRKKELKNLTSIEEINRVLDSLDETDELLKLKVDFVPKKMVIDKDGRRTWVPSGRIEPYSKRRDPYNLKERLFDLMQQSIHQLRTRMGTMQEMRVKYKNSSLYKMGFMISKTDIACRTFSSFAYKALRGCGAVRMRAIWRHSLIGVIESEERLLSLWMDIDLLVDLLRLNDGICRDMLGKVVENRKEAFKPVD